MGMRATGRVYGKSHAPYLKPGFLASKIAMAIGVDTKQLDL
jgi:hypothetical protein